MLYFIKNGSRPVGICCWALVVTVGFAGYSMLRINRVVTLKGVEHVWEVMLQRDACIC